MSDARANCRKQPICAGKSEGALKEGLEQIQEYQSAVFWSFSRKDYQKTNWWSKTARADIGSKLTIRTANTVRRIVDICKGKTHSFLVYQFHFGIIRYYLCIIIISSCIFVLRSLFSCESCIFIPF